MAPLNSSNVLNSLGRGLWPSLLTHWVIGSSHLNCLSTSHQTLEPCTFKSEASAPVLTKNKNKAYGRTTRKTIHAAEQKKRRKKQKREKKREKRPSLFAPNSSPTARAASAAPPARRSICCSWGHKDLEATKPADWGLHPALQVVCEQDLEPVLWRTLTCRLKGHHKPNQGFPHLPVLRTPQTKVENPHLPVLRTPKTKVGFLIAGLKDAKKW